MENRTRIYVTGIVQGVGFRPFVYNLARKYNLRGFCLNDTRGVVIEVEGDGIDGFIEELKKSPPPLSRIENLTTESLPSARFKDFRIEESLHKREMFTLISPDISTCTDCLRELFSPGDRRYLYPFINCTNCGPRYSIVLDIPYDRVNTTMKVFRMCGECEREYNDPLNRRFHAQPNACEVCGPEVWLIEKGENPEGDRETKNFSAIKKTAELLLDGAIVAIKGLGGFHLACDATNTKAVRTLRERKRKNNKPFAIMALDVETVKTFCRVSSEEEEILKGRVRPIVIMEKVLPSPISPDVAPSNNYLGVMLPYTPIHHLLFNVEGARFTALVMTSGNIADEPIVTSNPTALKRLSSIADFFLLHNRDICMRVDDSIVRVRKRKTHTIRRARGFVPEPLDMGEEMADILATGAELKNTFCITKGRYAIMSQHIGDLENMETLDFFREVLRNLKNTFRSDPHFVAHDLHPDYLSTRFAEEYHREIERHHSHTDIIPVQHHHAHIVSVMAEHNIKKEVIGVAFDGTGYGLDGRIWGGEFLVASRKDFVRKAHLNYVPLPGGDRAVKEPWRMAVSYLYHTFGDEMTGRVPSFFKRFERKRIDAIVGMIKRGINSPLTSSVGRLFDCISSLAGIRDVVTFEAESAIELEMIAGTGCGMPEPFHYPFDLIRKKRIIIDTRPIIKGVVYDIERGCEPKEIAIKFHHTMAEIILGVVRILREERDINDVVLSGGVFQNRILLDLAGDRLEREGFKVWLNERVPANDGGISLGQAIVAWENIRDLYGKSLKRH